MLFFRHLNVAVLMLSAIVLSACQSHATPPIGMGVSGVVNIGTNRFYTALAPYGTWIEHSTYGQVWNPSGMAADWRPYSDGQWLYTQNYGWYWQSAHQWGWAPFHYGRWAFDNVYGWLWIPGEVWSPAWVVWRSGGGYNAWAAMPPTMVWQNGLNHRYFNADRDLGWQSWVMVSDTNFMQSNLGGYIFPPYLNSTFIPQTTYIQNNITYINNTVVNHGIPVHHIEQVTGHHIKPVQPDIQYGDGHHSHFPMRGDQPSPESLQREELIAQRAQALQEQHKLQQQEVQRQQQHREQLQNTQQQQLQRVEAQQQLNTQQQQQDTLRQQQLEQQQQIELRRQQDLQQQQLRQQEQDKRAQLQAEQQLQLQRVEQQRQLNLQQQQQEAARQQQLEQQQQIELRRQQDLQQQQEAARQQLQVEQQQQQLQRVEQQRQLNLQQQQQEAARQQQLQQQQQMQQRQQQDMMRQQQMQQQNMLRQQQMQQQRLENNRQPPAAPHKKPARND